MGTKIREIQPMVAENWVRYDSNPQDAQLIQPVASAEMDAQGKTENEGRPQQGNSRPGMDPQKSKELAEEVQRFMEDFNIEVNFKIHEKTGDVVVQILNRDTGEMIRQIPSENLVKLHDKLVELRGVLFEGKV